MEIVYREQTHARIIEEAYRELLQSFKSYVDGRYIEDIEKRKQMFYNHILPKHQLIQDSIAPKLQVYEPESCMVDLSGEEIKLNCNGQ